MIRWFQRFSGRAFFALGILLLASLLLGGCLHDDDDDDDVVTTTTAATTTTTASTTTTTLPGSDTVIEGTAATGAPLSGFLYVRDALGVEINTPIAGDGSFEVVTTGMTPPLILRAIGGAGSDGWYSWINGLQGHVNVTPFTSLAMYLAANEESLEAMYDAWVTRYDEVTQAGIDNAVAVVNGNLAAHLQAAGLDPDTYDFFGSPFSANGQGIDRVYDAIQVVLDFLGGSFSLVDLSGGSIQIPFDKNWSGSHGQGGNAPSGATTWKITISGTTTTMGVTTVLPETVLTDVPGDEVPTDPGSVDVEDLLVEVFQDSGITLSNVTSDLDTSAYDGTVGSIIELDLAGTMTVMVQGFSAESAFDLHYVFELVSTQ